MIHLSNKTNKYIVLFFIIINCTIVINASSLTADSTETVSPNNEDKTAVPEELDINVDDLSKTAAGAEPTDDESRSIKADVLNDDSVTSEIIARTDFTPTEEIKEKRSTDIGLLTFLGDSDLRSDSDDFDMADSGPTEDNISKTADDSVNQEQRSDTEDTARSEQNVDESKAATETDDFNIGRTDTDVNNERVAPSEESSDNVRTESRDAEETVELDSPTDGFIRGSRRMLESGDILEMKGRSGENEDITRTIPTPDLRSLNALNPFGSSASRRNFKSDVIVPHVHAVLNSPNVLYPNVYGIPNVPNMIINRAASAEMNPVSRSFPFYPDSRSLAQTHTHAHASAETNLANQMNSKEAPNTYPYVPTQNPMDGLKLMPNNFDLLKKLTDASTMPIKPNLFSAENIRPFSNLFNTANQGYPSKMNQNIGPRIRRSVRMQRRFQQNLIL